MGKLIEKPQLNEKTGIWTVPVQTQSVGRVLAKMHQVNGQWKFRWSKTGECQLPDKVDRHRAIVMVEEEKSRMKREKEYAHLVIVISRKPVLQLLLQLELEIIINDNR